MSSVVKDIHTARENFTQKTSAAVNLRDAFRSFDDTADTVESVAVMLEEAISEIESILASIEQIKPQVAVLRAVVKGLFRGIDL